MGCFANKNGVCTILQQDYREIKATSTNCDECAFYKTHKQYATDRLTHLEREIEFTQMTSSTADRLRGKLVEQLKGDVADETDEKDV